MLEPGQIVDRYAIVSVLGEGGQGRVYRVRHTVLGSDHALKVLMVHGTELKRRLLREGRAQARLRHPNVVAVTDVVEVDGAPGLVMDYVAGPSLREWIDRVGPVSLPAFKALAQGVLEGVEEAHAQGLVHRDLKPANVILSPSKGAWTPRITDFGLVKALDVASTSATRTGAMMGTPRYMAPEQFDDCGRVDERADVFSLGCMLYELLAGTPAYAQTSTMALMKAISLGEHPPLEDVREGLPVGLILVIEEAMASDREHRLQDVASLRVACMAALQDVQAEPPGMGGWQAPVAPVETPVPPRSPLDPPPPASPVSRPPAPTLGPESLPEPPGVSDSAEVLPPEPATPVLSEVAAAPKVPLHSEADQRSEVDQGEAETRSRWGAPLLLGGLAVAVLAGVWILGDLGKSELSEPPGGAPADAVSESADKPREESGARGAGDPGSAAGADLAIPAAAGGPAEEAAGQSSEPDPSAPDASKRTPPPPPAPEEATSSGTSSPEAPTAVAEPVETEPPPGPPPTGTAIITVNAVPYSYVSIDGTPLGSTPLRKHSLGAGRHEVQLRTGEGETHTISVTLADGDDTFVCWDFSSGTDCS